MRALAATAVALAAALVLAAATTRGADSASACAGSRVTSLGNARVAYAATARRTLHAYRAPGHETFHLFHRLNVNDVPNVFGVLSSVSGPGCGVAWYHVLLPIRPNGATGYVRADLVSLSRTNLRIIVDLSQRRLYLYRGARELLQTSAAVGASATPTPLGRYYVNQRLLADPRGPYGPAALGISAFSPVLIHWAQGGPVGIHGTNEPWSIGHPVSNGCVRVPNAVIRKLWRAVPVGTPVLIRA